MLRTLLLQVLDGNMYQIVVSALHKGPQVIGKKDGASVVLVETGRNKGPFDTGELALRPKFRDILLGLSSQTHKKL